MDGVRRSVTGTDRWPIQFGSAPREALELKPPTDETGFASDKIWYAGRRDGMTEELVAGGLVRVDFGRARYSTQSALHALLYEPLRRLGPWVLDRIWFENAQPQVRAVLVQVIDYALAHHEAKRDDHQPVPR